MIDKVKDSLKDRILKEIQACKKSPYPRYETPCDWNNIDITVNIEMILINLLMDCTHEEELDDYCETCNKSFKEAFTVV